MPAFPTATDAEIEAAAKQLGLNGAYSASPQRNAGVGQILQSLARGRSHMVSVEIKSSSSRLATIQAHRR
jgi:hypothetical protein